MLRYSVFQQILKYTAESHPDHQQLLDALEHTQELCSQVNEGVREKENSDRLEWIQQHVQCDGLAEVCEVWLGILVLGGEVAQPGTVWVGHLRTV